MSTVELTCNSETITIETPPPHLYICCGFEEYPASFKGSYSLETTKSATCVSLYGMGGTFTLSRAPCGTIYSVPSLPFYLVLPTPNPLCCGDPNEENDHISNWGLGPGSVIYAEGNGCVRDPDTGAVSFFLSAQHVGPGDCLFTVTVDEVVMP